MPDDDSKNLAIMVGGGAAILLGLAIIGDQLSRWTTLTDWIEALSTAAAFLAAIVAARYAIGAFKLESLREYRWQQAQISAQASLVAAWFGTHQAEVDPSSKMGRIARLFGPDLGIYVRNASEVPVQAVRVAVVFPFRGVVAVLDVGVVPPDTEPTFTSFSYEVSVKVEEYASEPVEEKTWNAPETEVFFIDSSGVEWLRNAGGELEREPQPWWIYLSAGLHTLEGETLIDDTAVEGDV